MLISTSAISTNDTQTYSTYTDTPPFTFTEYTFDEIRKQIEEFESELPNKIVIPPTEQEMESALEQFRRELEN